MHIGMVIDSKFYTIKIREIMFLFLDGSATMILSLKIGLCDFGPKNKFVPTSVR
jgi:hypothetical protein